MPSSNETKDHLADMDRGFRVLLPAPASSEAPPPPAPSLDMMRLGYQKLRQSQDKAPPQTVYVVDLDVAGGAAPIKARLYTPSDVASPTGLLVYFHGGGFVVGDLESHDGHCRRLAAFSGHRILAVEYRLAPEHAYPAAHDDALAATRWAFDQAAALSVDPARIAVGGDSAGANLAVCVALELASDPVRRPVFQLLLYPLTFPREETPSRQAFDGPVVTRAALGMSEMAYGLARHADGDKVRLDTRDLDGAPPTYIVTAGIDPLRDEGRRLAERLSQAGVATTAAHYPSMVHEFFQMPDLSAAVLPAAQAAAAVLAQALASRG